MNALLLTLACAGFLGAMIGNGLGGFLMLSLTDRGSSLMLAGLVASAGATLNVIVRLTAGFAADRRPRSVWKLLMGMFLVSLVGTALLTSTVTAFAIMGALLAYGGGWGWAGLLHYVTSTSYPGRENRATAYSQMGVSLGAAVGPLISGMLWTLTPDLVWWALTAAGCLAVIAVDLARRMAKSEKSKAHHSVIRAGRALTRNAGTKPCVRLRPRPCLTPPASSPWRSPPCPSRRGGPRRSARP